MQDITNNQKRKQILGLYGQEPIQKSEANDLEKGGEGSKGGKVIGHTKSGKPVYEGKSLKNVHPSQNHPSDYTAQDHKDAAEIHNKLSNKHLEQFGDTDKGSDYRKAGHHAEMASYHEDKAGMNWKKEGKSHWKDSK